MGEVLSFNGPKAPGGKVPSRVFANGGNYSDQGLFWPVGGETLTVLHPLFPDVIVVPDVYYNQSAPSGLTVSEAVLFVYMQSNAAVLPTPFCWPFEQDSKWTRPGSANIAALVATPSGTNPKTDIQALDSALCLSI